MLFVCPFVPTLGKLITFMKHGTKVTPSYDTPT